MDPLTRSVELRGNLAKVQARITAACHSADRDAREITLVVVTKHFPASDVRLLAQLGVTDVGENRHPEAQYKKQECADLQVRWHFIGALQSNKAATVASYADVVESVDRAKLVPPLARGAGDALAGRKLRCLVQVSLDSPQSHHSRAGVAPAELLALASLVQARPELELGGLMAVAPLQEDPARAFARLAEIQAVFLKEHPEARQLSAGMSGDLEQAIRYGATHVRVGRSVLGARALVE